MKNIALIFLSLFCSTAASAQFLIEPRDFFKQSPQTTKNTDKSPKLIWNVEYSHFLDNREYDVSGNVYATSRTLHAARLTPSVGFELMSSPSVRHSVMLGADMVKVFGDGSQNLDLFREFTLHYDVDAVFRNGGKFSAAAGCFPRTFSEGEQDGIIFERQHLFFDPNVEGVYFKYRRNNKIYADLGLDWMGLYAGSDDPFRRERFQIVSTGEWNFAKTLSLHWNASFFHFGCCMAAPNVVDNHIVHPWLKWSPSTSLQELSFTAGGLAGYQCDRIRETGSILPWAFVSTQTIRKWNAGVRNSVWYGMDLCPLFDYYGTELYFEDSNFHFAGEVPFIYDRLTLFYEPQIAEYVKLRIECMFHFGTGDSLFRGSQQIVSLLVDLPSKRSALKAPAQKHKAVRLGDLFQL